MIKFGQAKEIRAQLKTNADRYRPLWERTSKYVGIRVDPQESYTVNESNKSRQLDEYVDDPTAALSVTQFGDYIYGLFWGSGDKAVSIVPSRYVKREIADEKLVSPFYQFITEEMLYQANHRNAGFSSSFKSALYDFNAFGTGGLGCFKNRDYSMGNSDNVAVFRQFGIDNTAIDEGASGSVDYLSCDYHWRIGRIVGEFAMKDGVIDKGLLAKLPLKIRQKWERGQLNETETVVYMFLPNTDYSAGTMGKKGAKFIGLWWFGDISDEFARVDYYPEKPVGMGRMIKVRNEVYGRGSGGMLLSTIAMVNYFIALTADIAEKMGEPATGTFSSAVFGDNAIDLSSGEITVFNSEFSGNKPPIFPLYDLGDPSAIIQFIVPYLNEKVTTGFKIDTLLDFNTEREQTATESMQRYGIRARSHFATTQQIRHEIAEPNIRRLISMMGDQGLLGVDPVVYKERAAELTTAGRIDMIIPDVVLRVMKSGKPWYDLRFNNEIEDLSRVERMEKIMRLLQSIQVIQASYPDIVYAVDWHKIAEEFEEVLAPASGVLRSKREFDKILDGVKQMQQQQQQMQQAQMGAAAAKDAAQAEKASKEAGINANT